MRRRCFVGGIGMHAIAKLAEIIEGTPQHLGAARHFDTTGSKRVAQFQQGLFLKSQSTFDIDQSLLG